MLKMLEISREASSGSRDMKLTHIYGPVHLLRMMCKSSDYGRLSFVILKAGV